MKVKESGIYYLKQIPFEWDIKRYKYCGNSRMGVTIVKEDLIDNGNIPVYSASMDDEIFGYLNKTSLILKKGDLVIGARGTIGYMKIIKEEIATCTQTTICTRTKADYNPKFIRYSSIALNDEWNPNEGSGVPQLTVERLNNNYLCKPNIKEQDLIVSFLDKKMDKIEDIIDEINNQIKILEKYKNSLITETILFGINNEKSTTVKNKFIKQIANNFIITKVKYVCSKITDGSHESPETENGIWPFISTVDIIDEKLNFNDCLKTSKESFTRLVKQNCKPLKGDVLISKDGTVGKTVYIDFEKDYVVASSLVILRPINNIIDSKYLKYNLDADFNQEYLKQLMTGSALKRVSVEKNANLYIVLSSINEQKEIVNYLDKKCKNINDLIKNKQEQIEKMEQYKKSLIYEYVTGKKRVKGAEELYG